MGRRGQISLFIIIGLIIAMTTMFFLYQGSKTQEAQSQEIGRTLGNLDESVFKRFLNSCLSKAGESTLWLMGSQGGYTTYGHLNLHNSVPYGVGMPVPFFVPIYMNVGDNIRTQGNLILVADAVGTPISVDLRSTGAPLPAHMLREITTPLPPEANMAISVSAITMNAADQVWTGTTLPSLEELRSRFMKHTLVLFEKCVEEGIGPFLEYTDIQKPTDIQAYNDSREIWFSDVSTTTDFSYPSSGTGLGYTPKKVTLTAAFNDNDVSMALSYPLKVTDATHAITVDQLSVVHDVGFKRLHNIIGGFLKQVRIANTRPVGDDPTTTPTNIYRLTTPECVKYEGQNTITNGLPLNGKTNIYVSRMLDMRTMLATLPRAANSVSLTNQERTLCPIPAMAAGRDVLCRDHYDALESLLTNDNVNPPDGDLLPPAYTDYQLIRFVDYRPKEIKYNAPFIFQFALKNVNVVGSCPPPTP